MQEALERDKRVAFLDFQLFGRDALLDANSFYQQFCLTLTDALQAEDKVQEYWDTPLSNNQRCTRYMGKHLLPSLNAPVVLAMDEVETVFDTTFRADFFAMLRSWHNNRAVTGSDPGWKRLDLALVTSTEPYQLIDDLHQSPFNVGEVVDLSDFTLDQVRQLNQLHTPSLDEEQAARLHLLVAGHPYLTRRALYLLAQERYTAQEFFETAALDNGPFGDHLRYHLLRLSNKPDQMKAMRLVINKSALNDEQMSFRLRGAGLVRLEKSVVVPRCSLYAEYFGRHLRV